MICGRSLLSRCKGDIITIPWKLIIVDEFHEFKNEKTNNYKALYDIKDLSDCPVIGLTGTLFQKHSTGAGITNPGGLKTATPLRPTGAEITSL